MGGVIFEAYIISSLIVIFLKSFQYHVVRKLIRCLPHVGRVKMTVSDKRQGVVNSSTATIDICLCPLLRGELPSRIKGTPFSSEFH